MVEALKTDKLRIKEAEHDESGELELTDIPLTVPNPASNTFIQNVHIKTPSNLSVHIHGIIAPDLITVVGHIRRKQIHYIYGKETTDNGYITLASPKGGDEGDD